MSLRDILLSIALAVLIMALGALGWQLIQNNPIQALPQPPTVYNAALQDSFSDLKTAAEYVSQIHDDLNNMVGYGDISLFTPEGPGWIVFKQKMPSISAKLDSIKSLGGSGPILEDLAIFSTLLNIGLELREHQAMVYAHRIIHDLDYYVFESPRSVSDPSDNWDSTITLNGANSKVIKQWINERR